MAKDRKKLQHIHSSVPDKQPTPATIEVGEIAVNNAAEQEFLSVKNSSNKVVRFSSDGQVISWIERKEVMPYVGYVRGDGGPAVTSGDTPTSDEKGSYGISNDDLLNNKSELVFKLNQVAADLTTKHDKVNGAKDMYNKEINPTDDFGVNDGAGFFIDMSRYAMRDGNPSFSSLTDTCQTTLSGNTFIRDGASGNTYGTDTGHTLDIKITDTVVSGETWHETLTSKGENISGRTTTIGNDGENLHVIGTTTEVHDDDVTITNKSNVAENTSGTTTINIVEDNIVNVSGETHITTTGNTAIHTESKLGLTAVDDIIESSEANIIITANEDVCETAGVNASFYGVTKTNVGLDCADSSSSTTTNVYGETMNVDASTANTVIGTADTKITSATTLIGTNTITVSGNTVENHSGTTTENFNGNFSGNTSGTTTENKGGDVIENNKSNKTENTTNKHSIYSSGDTCINSQTNANFYGKVSTNIGVACDGTPGSATTVVGTSTLGLSGETITMSGDTIIDGTLNVSGVTTIGDTLIIKEGVEKKLSWYYGDVRQEGSGETNFKTDESFVIPKSIDDLTNWNNSCITLPHDVCVNGTVTASGAIYSSDRNLKENIKFIDRNEFSKVTAIPLHSFNLKSDENKNKMFGIIAQEVQDAGLGDIVYTKEDGTLAVDYTSLMILHIAYLQDLCGSLNGRVIELEEKLNKLENKK